MEFERNIQIEDAGRHSSATMIRLQRLLSTGPKMVPDPKREHFFEVPAEPCVFYVHVSPISGKISLLAVWGSEPGVDCAGRAA